MSDSDLDDCMESVAVVAAAAATTTPPTARDTAKERSGNHRHEKDKSDAKEKTKDRKHENQEKEKDKDKDKKKKKAGGEDVADVINAEFRRAKQDEECSPRHGAKSSGAGRAAASGSGGGGDGGGGAATVTKKRPRKVISKWEGLVDTVVLNGDAKKAVRFYDKFTTESAKGVSLVYEVGKFVEFKDMIFRIHDMSQDPTKKGGVVRLVLYAPLRTVLDVPAKISAYEDEHHERLARTNFTTVVQKQTILDLMPIHVNTYERSFPDAKYFYNGDTFAALCISKSGKFADPNEVCGYYSVALFHKYIHGKYSLKYVDSASMSGNWKEFCEARGFTTVPQVCSVRGEPDFQEKAKKKPKKKRVRNVTRKKGDEEDNGSESTEAEAEEGEGDEEEDGEKAEKDEKEEEEEDDEEEEEEEEVAVEEEEPKKKKTKKPQVVSTSPREMAAMLGIIRPDFAGEADKRPSRLPVPPPPKPAHGVTKKKKKQLQPQDKDEEEEEEDEKEEEDDEAGDDDYADDDTAAARQRPARRGGDAPRLRSPLPVPKKSTAVVMMKKKKTLLAKQPTDEAPSAANTTDTRPAILVARLERLELKPIVKGGVLEWIRSIPSGSTTLEIVRMANTIERLVIDTTPI